MGIYNSGDGLMSAVDKDLKKKLDDVRSNHSFFKDLNKVIRDRAETERQYAKQLSQQASDIERTRLRYNQDGVDQSLMMTLRYISLDSQVTAVSHTQLGSSLVTDEYEAVPHRTYRPVNRFDVGVDLMRLESEVNRIHALTNTLVKKANKCDKNYSRCREQVLSVQNNISRPKQGKGDFLKTKDFAKLKRAEESKSKAEKELKESLALLQNKDSKFCQLVKKTKDDLDGQRQKCKHAVTDQLKEYLKAVTTSVEDMYKTNVDILECVSTSLETYKVDMDRIVAKSKRTCRSDVMTTAFSPEGLLLDINNGPHRSSVAADNEYKRSRLLRYASISYRNKNLTKILSPSSFHGKTSKTEERASSIALRKILLRNQLRQKVVHFAELVNVKPLMKNVENVKESSGCAYNTNMVDRVSFAPTSVNCFNTKATGDDVKPSSKLVDDVSTFESNGKVAPYSTFVEYLI